MCNTDDGIYKVTGTRKSNGENVDIFYNSKTSEFFCSSINIHECTARWIHDNPFRPFNNMYRIGLGKKCNLSCAYCMGIPESWYNYDSSIKDAGTFVSRIQKVIKHPPSGFLFVGGEPFVYIKTIKPLIQRLREVYPFAWFNIITNGSLFDATTIDWCRQNNIRISLSFDGRIDDKYRPNAFNYPYTLDVVRELDDVIISSCITPGNTNIVKLVNCVYEVVGKQINIRVIPLARTQLNTIGKVPWFTEQEKLEISETLYKAVTMFPLMGINNLNRMIHSILNIQIPAYNHLPTFSLDGNFVNMIRNVYPTNQAPCNTCFAQKYCLPTGNHRFWHMLSCYNGTRAYYEGVFKYIVDLLFSVNVSSMVKVN